MKAGFISPSFRMLELNWQHDFEMIKLGVPTLMARLHAAGWRDLSHWDFDADVCDAIERDPTAFDLKKYFDAELVRGFLAGESDALRPQTERLLDTLGVTERDVYGISLSAVLDRIANVTALAAVAQCMAKVLKERAPHCTVVLGGLQVNPDALQQSYYERFMRGCAAIDYALIGAGDEAAVALFGNVATGAHEANHAVPRVIYRHVEADGTSEPRLSSGGGLPTIVTLKRSLHTAHHPAHTRIGAAAQRDRVVAEAALLADAERAEPVAAPREATTRDATSDAEGSPAAGEAAPARALVDLDLAPPRGVPLFDPALVDKFRYSGRQIMRRFHFDEELLLKYSRFEGDRIVVLPHIFVRGCNAPCGFCGYAYNPIDGEDVVRTVEGLKFLSETYDCKHFHFLNTQINSVYEYCDTFCDAILAANLEIFWSDCCNMRFVDEKLLEKMRRAGAMRLVFGVESPEDSMLDFIHKGVDVATIERMLKVSHDLGIWNHVLLIAGMPHETKAKLDAMVSFFERTAETIDFYTVSSFYLIASSPWGKNPEKFGIERLTGSDRLLEDQAFNERSLGRFASDDLPWAAKKKQIVEATSLFYRTISRVKGQSRCVGGNVDLYLLMFLYSALGHDRKAEIRRIYEQTAQYVLPSISASRNGAASEEVLGPEAFKIRVPVVVGRVNEADQSSLLQLDVTMQVTPRDDQKRALVASKRFMLSYRLPSLLDVADRMIQTDVAALRESVPSLMGAIGKLVRPLLDQIEGRYAPATPEQMAELLAHHLGRYKAFQNLGYGVVPPRSGRSIDERMLEWSGVRPPT